MKFNRRRLTESFNPYFYEAYADITDCELSMNLRQFSISNNIHTTNEAVAELKKFIDNEMRFLERENRKPAFIDSHCSSNNPDDAGYTDECAVKYTLRFRLPHSAHNQNVSEEKFLGFVHNYIFDFSEDEDDYDYTSLLNDIIYDCFVYSVEVKGKWYPEWDDNETFIGENLIKIFDSFDIKVIAEYKNSDEADERGW